MAISDLKARQGNVDLTLTVVSKDAVREFEKFGKQGRVCNAIAEDKTGKIKLTLWNEQIDMVNEGDQVHISNGYVGEWQGELQLSTGKMGKLEVVGKVASPALKEAPKEDSESKADVSEEDIEF